MNTKLITHPEQGDSVHASHQPLNLHKLIKPIELGHHEFIHSVTMNGGAKHEPRGMASITIASNLFDTGSFHAAHSTISVTPPRPTATSQQQFTTTLSIPGGAKHGKGTVTCCTPFTLSNCVQTADAAHLPSAAMDTLSPSLSPTTAPTNGQAEGINGEGVNTLRNEPISIPSQFPYTLETLKAFNRSTAERHRNANKPAAIFNSLTVICEYFVNHTDCHVIDKLMRSFSHEDALNQLQIIFQNTFYLLKGYVSALSESPFNDDEHIAMSLELLISSIIPRQSVDERQIEFVAPGFGYDLITRVKYAAMDHEETVANLMRKEADTILHREVSKRRRIYASPTEDLEPDATLSPRKKAQYFYAALRSRNDIGRLVKWAKGKRFFEGYEHRFERDLIFHEQDKRRAEAFFEDHPDVSVADLLELLDHCVEVYVKEVDRNHTDYDPLLLIKQGRKIQYLLANTERIAQLLDEHFKTSFKEVFCN